MPERCRQELHHLHGAQHHQPDPVRRVRKARLVGGQLLRAWPPALEGGGRGWGAGLWCPAQARARRSFPREQVTPACRGHRDAAPQGPGHRLSVWGTCQRRALPRLQGTFGAFGVRRWKEFCSCPRPLKLLARTTTERTFMSHRSGGPNPGPGCQHGRTLRGLFLAVGGAVSVLTWWKGRGGAPVPSCRVARSWPKHLPNSPLPNVLTPRWALGFQHRNLGVGGTNTQPVVWGTAPARVLGSLSSAPSVTGSMRLAHG